MKPQTIALVSAICFALVRVLKTGRLDALLRKLGRPPLPRAAYAWLAVGLGLVIAVLEELATKDGSAGSVLLTGAMAGLMAIGTNETAGPASRALGGPLSRLVVGPPPAPQPVREEERVSVPMAPLEGNSEPTMASRPEEEPAPAAVDERRPRVR